MEFPDGLNIGAARDEVHAGVELRTGKVCYRRAHRVLAALFRSANPPSASSEVSNSFRRSCGCQAPGRD